MATNWWWVDCGRGSSGNTITQSWRWHIWYCLSLTDCKYCSHASWQVLWGSEQWVHAVQEWNSGSEVELSIMRRRSNSLESYARKCLDAGKNVTSCSMEFFRKVKAMCASEFMTYATCLERGSSNMEFSHCRWFWRLIRNINNNQSVSETLRLLLIIVWLRIMVWRDLTMGITAFPR